MSGRTEERAFLARVAERPKLEASRIKDVRARDLLIRFAAGALTSIVAGLLTLAFGSRLGGIMLGFPAILAASLTLIKQEEDAAHAREDARGAVAGGCAMVVFALAAALTFGHLSAVLVLLIATGAWTVTALGLYLIVWFR